jgi:hypothetical protein
MIVDALKKAISKLYPQKASTEQLEKELLRREAAIGASLFGPMPAGHLRQFVCFDDKTILWYESQSSVGKPITTRYEVYEDHIVKAQDGQPAQTIPEIESHTLLHAVRWYHYLVAKNLYGVAL